MSETLAEPALDAVDDAAASLSPGGQAEARLESAALERDEALADLAAHADAGAKIRREADKAELRLALRELAEGMRGIVRVAPLTAVLAGVAAGMLLSRRRRPRRPAGPR